ncbi:MAG: tRNA guanosine(34) transglycosylase Tgt [Planctomycetota bacterium]
MHPGFGFRVVAGTPEGARIGRLQTPHGEVETPAFMVVGTRGAVKGVSPDLLEQVGAKILLANTYHLAVRPGEDSVHALGGLHRFSGWSGPILTDSGGFQVLSLADLRSIDDEEVRFRSHIDGQELRLTPERVLDIQARLGTDIAMVLDDCPPPGVDRAGARKALERTLKWAERSVRHRESSAVGDSPMAVFGILQGGAFEDLRQEGAERLRELPFDGYAIGGVSVGESRDVLLQTIPWGARHLPVDRPRYLMGVAGFTEFVHAIDNGVDLFDCVLPTRNARNGYLFRRNAPPVRIKNQRYRDDDRPIEEGCDCSTCQRYSRGFLRHLRLSREILFMTLASIHNLRVFYGFLDDAREAIRNGSWGAFRDRFWSEESPDLP